jgi:hypothetical protein
MTDSDFVFVGYLVQERYVRNWWKREGKRLASLENTVHPSFEKPQWQSVGGVLNLTEFLLTPPDMSEFPVWLLYGYSVEREAIPRLHVEILDPQKGRIVGPLQYEYALHLARANDDLKALGYEVIDATIERLSILNNCGYSIEEIESNVGRLNEFSLFETAEDARKFQRYIKTSRFSFGSAVGLCPRASCSPHPNCFDRCCADPFWILWRDLRETLY